MGVERWINLTTPIEDSGRATQPENQYNLRNLYFTHLHAERLI
jgi:hypothetical protein